ncbi:long-chain-fatty-acid--CoA ligase 6-like [Anneissia japonica]|uniref:long-chain-fatty-acid--CoA ligase 6-like n=1 Tax=Anneissia japonica TaxID=1529436 RepID=UPI00142584A9|nr:long-chain-fatty-acid--CoA ligase 6-like [Anneissia japonica]
MTATKDKAGVLAVREKLGLKDVDFQQQSVVLPGDEGVHINPMIKGPEDLMTHYYEDVRTLYDAFQRGIRISGDGQCLGWRESGKPYTFMKYSEVFERSKNFGAGLIANGCEPNSDTFIGIYSSNCVEWICTEQACNAYSMVIVPLYDTLGPEACKFIINQANIKVTVCDKEERCRKLLEQASEMESLKYIIVVQDVSEEVKETAKKLNVSILSFADVEKTGKETSKDVVSHIQFSPDDVYYSYLPLAHMYERFALTNFFMHGSKVGFFQGDIKLMTDDLATLKPTFMACVPRIMNRVYDKVMAKVQNGGFLKRWIFHLAMLMKSKEVEKNIVRNDGMWDGVFNQVRDSLGGRVRGMTAGAAPVSAEVKRFWQCFSGAYLVEGFGQTEATCICTLAYPTDNSLNHQGAPIASCMMKVVDVPEMDYYAKNGQGEICMKGPSITNGYYKNEEKTRDTYDSDGWLHSGDIGEWTECGQIRIIDRKKNIFKLSHGEYVAPEKIENVYLRCEYVSQIFVHGESLQSCLVAVVVPDPETLPRLAKAHRVEGDYEVMCKSEVLKTAIFEDLRKLAKESGLKSFEQVKVLHLTSEAFSIENNLLTPTLKSKRAVLRNYFKDEVEKMYEAVNS